MLQQMDNSVYTFEQLLQQSINSGGSDDLCKVIQRCQDRVLKVTLNNVVHMMNAMIFLERPTVIMRIFSKHLSS